MLSHKKNLMEEPSLTADHTPAQAPLIFQWGIFPIVMGLSVLCSWWLMAGGMAPPLAILGPQFAAFAIVATV